MKRGVEDGDVRNVRKRLARPRERSERGAVVQRRELAQRVDLALDLRVDHDRGRKPLAAVDDAVADRVYLDEVVDRLRLLASHQRQFQRHRAGVDDEDVQGADTRIRRQTTGRGQ
jgi:hypothetical protein